MAEEAQLEARAKRYATQQDVLFYKMVSPGRRGFPDRLLIGPDGKIAFVEFKASNGRTSDLQDRELTLLAKRKVRAFTCCNFAEAKSVIDGLLEDPPPAPGWPKERKARAVFKPRRLLTDRPYEDGGPY